MVFIREGLKNPNLERRNKMKLGFHFTCFGTKGTKNFLGGEICFENYL